ncbi:MAG: DUF5723 family protein [Balneolaceae bacterium]
MLALGLPVLASSQALYSPKNIALGGGGTTYVTGYESLFINPANIRIRDKEARIQFSILQAGGYTDTPFRINDPQDRLTFLEDRFTPFVPGTQMVGADDRGEILDRFYNSDRLSAEFLTASEIHWFGVSWFRENRSYALALRTRTFSRSRVGRGFYDASPISIDGLERIDQSLTHRYQTLHELSFGYARSFSFLSGLFPQLSDFIIGIAPKVVVSGPMLDMEYRNRYDRPAGDPLWQRTESFETSASGAFSESARQMMSTGDPAMSTAGAFGFNEMFTPSGIGAGLDIGITYLATFGRDLSAVRPGEETTERSLRLSFSLTDLGAIQLYDNPFQTEIVRDTTITTVAPPVSSVFFGGSPAEDLFFLSQSGPHPLQRVQSSSSGNYQMLLPTAFNMGALFQLNRIKLTGDFRVGITDNAFITPKFKTFVGAEIRPLPFWPLRAGTRFATNLPGYYSLGSGIETRYFDLSAAIQFRTDSGEPTLEPVGAAAVAIKVYIP